MSTAKSNNWSLLNGVSVLRWLCSYNPLYTDFSWEFYKTEEGLLHVYSAFYTPYIVNNMRQTCVKPSEDILSQNWIYHLTHFSSTFMLFTAWVGLKTPKLSTIICQILSQWEKVPRSWIDAGYHETSGSILFATSKMTKSSLLAQFSLVLTYFTFLSILFILQIIWTADSEGHLKNN